MWDYNTLPPDNSATEALQNFRPLFSVFFNWNPGLGWKTDCRYHLDHKTHVRTTHKPKYRGYAGIPTRRVFWQCTRSQVKIIELEPT